MSLNAAMLALAADPRVLFLGQANGVVTAYNPKTVVYSYERQWPHVGSGKFVTFG